MDKYTEYLLDQINSYREMENEVPIENPGMISMVKEELLNALVQYQNSMDCRNMH